MARDARWRGSAAAHTGLRYCHNAAKLPFDNACDRDPARFRPTPRPCSRMAARFHVSRPLNENTDHVEPGHFP